MNSDPKPPESGPNSDLSNLAGQHRLRDIPKPPPIPDHQMLRCIGLGSYGSVWLARNLMGVYRAVKIVHRKAFESSRPFDRELSGIRKFEPISRSHAGFVDVLHIGQNEQEGCFYYVMELADDEVRGQQIDPQYYSPRTLSKTLAHLGRLPVADCVKLGLDLSQALSELHRNGLVHRDVKPANIVFCDKVPKLADIGLVTESNKEVSYVGTEGFIPPEGPGSAQADIYSLGKVLYEAATGKDRLDFPAMPGDLDKMSDSAAYLELNEVILKACETKAEGRYSTAWDMHADLVVLANGKSVQRLRALERGFARLKRAAAIAAIVILCGGLVGFEIYRGKEVERKNRERLVGEKVANWTASMENGDMLGGLLSSADALMAEDEDPANTRAQRLRFGSALALCPKLTFFKTNYVKEEVRDAIFSPDGTKVLLSMLNQPIQIHDPANATIEQSFQGEEFSSKSVSFSKDGTRMATGEAGGRFRVWDLTNHTKLCDYTISNAVATVPVMTVEMSLDGQRLLVAFGNSALVYNVDAKTVELQLPEGSNLVQHAVFSHHGKWIATTGKDKTVRIYDAENGEPLGPTISLKAWGKHLAFSPDDTRLAVACNDHTARIYDMTSNSAHLMGVLRHNDGVNSVEYSPDGRLIVTASYDRTVGLWTAQDYMPLWPNPKLQLGERAQCARFDAEGSKIVAVTVKGTIRVFDLAGCLRPPIPSSQRFSRDRTRYLEVQESAVRVMDSASTNSAAQISKPGSHVVEALLDDCGRRLMVLLEDSSSNTANRTTEVFDVETGRSMGPPLPLTLPLGNLFLSPDGSSLAAVDGKFVSLWTVTNASRSWNLDSGTNGILRIEWCPGGGEIAVLSSNLARFCHPVTGTNLFAPLELSDPKNDFSDLRFSPDGRGFVICEKEPNFAECSATLRNAATGVKVGEPMGHSDGVIRGVFSPNRRWICTGGEDFKLYIWSAVDATHVSGPMSHGQQVMGIDFSSDSEWIASASADMTTRVWRRDRGEPLTPPLRLRFPQTDVRFIAGDKKLVVTTGKAPNIQTWIWELPTEKRTAEEIEVLAHFLNGTIYHPPAESGSASAKSLEEVFLRLKAQDPKLFATTTEDLLAWHQTEADIAYDANRDGFSQEFAYYFHTNRLAQLKAGMANAAAAHLSGNGSNQSR